MHEKKGIRLCIKGISTAQKGQIKLYKYDLNSKIIPLSKVFTSSFFHKTTIERKKSNQFKYNLHISFSMSPILSINQSIKEGKN